MNSYKICPVCKKQNIVAEMICSNCFNDISGVSITDNTSKKHTVVLQLCFSKDNTQVLKFTTTCMVGRDAVGGEYFSEYSTISRFHARIILETDQWYIEDNQSTNGTYLNGKQLEPLKKVLIQEGDAINLSSAVGLNVRFASY